MNIASFVITYPALTCLSTLHFSTWIDVSSTAFSCLPGLALPRKSLHCQAMRLGCKWDGPRHNQPPEVFNFHFNQNLKNTNGLNNKFKRKIVLKAGFITIKVLDRTYILCFCLSPCIFFLPHKVQGRNNVLDGRALLQHSFCNTGTISQLRIR